MARAAGSSRKSVAGRHRRAGGVNRGALLSAPPDEMRNASVPFSSPIRWEFALRSTPTESNPDKGTNTVGTFSRRNFLAGSVVAVAGFTTINWSIAPGAAEAAQPAQAVMIRPHRQMRSRHRRWGCWWQRDPRWWHWGHRICGWR